MGVSRDSMRSEPLGRGAYAKLPGGSGQGNVAWEILKPLHGLSTSRKDWYRTIWNFPIEECGGKVASLDKAVFFWAKGGFRMATEGITEIRTKLILAIVSSK